MIRILLYQLVHNRDGLTFLYDSSEVFSIAGSFDSVINIRKHLHELQPDVVLLDIALDKGVDALGWIKKNNPKVKVVVLTNISGVSSLLTCLSAGADGYVLLGKTPPNRLMDYIKDTYEGGISISTCLMTEIIKILPLSGLVPNTQKLTKREHEILQLLVNGSTYKGISFDLNIAIDTVRSHIKNIYEKLKVNSKSEAVARALGEKIVLPLLHPGSLNQAI